MSHGEMGQASEWRIAVKGEQRGPYTLEQVRAMIAEGRLPLDALVWRPGMANWTPWSSVPELVALAGRGPAPGAAAASGPAGPMPPLAASPLGSTPLADFLAFRTMLTPVLIKILFWFGVVGCVLLGLADLVWSFRVNSIVALFSALAFIVAGPIVVRVWCEMMILWFRIHETLQEIKEQRR